MLYFLSLKLEPFLVPRSADTVSITVATALFSSLWTRQEEALPILAGRGIEVGANSLFIHVQKPDLSKHQELKEHS